MRGEKMKQLSMHVGSGPTSCLEQMLWIKHSVGIFLAHAAVLSLKGGCGDKQHCHEHIAETA